MDSRYQLRLLGTVEIVVDGEPVHAFPSRAAEAIVALAAMHDRPVTRARLVDMIWSDSEPKQAAANLRAILSALRRALGDLLIITRYDVAIDWEQDVWLDARDFASVVSQPGSDIAATEAALDLYRGDFLQDLSLRGGREFETWAAVERERLRRLAIEGVQRVAAASLEKASYAHGIRYATLWLALDPYSETAHQHMMWLRMRSGERHLALEQFAACERLLVKEFGVEPTARTRAVYERAVAMPEFGRNNFPASVTPFIGRIDELAGLRQLLNEPHTRLITLLGPGGMGKTRLALAFGKSLFDATPGRFLDGFFFVPLAAAYSSKAAIFAIANTVGLTLSGGRQPIQQLLSFLKEREMLLILDNLEHLVTRGEIVEIIEAILRAAPEVHIVVTSRTALGLYDEVIFTLNGLPLPPDNGRDGMAAVKDSAAVQLYLSQVQRTQRGYEPDAASLRAIVTTCRLLEGVPLGIELASAWARHYQPDEIAAAVGRSLDFLATPYHNVSPRQRSLRAAFDYSWRLLSEVEQALLAALSIFGGDFSTEAAQVAGATPALLSALRDKSLLRRSKNGTYSLHEVMRQFAAEHLTAERVTALNAAHAAYYSEWVAGLDLIQHYPTFQSRLALIRAQFVNVLQAWEWLVERLAGAPAPASALTGTMAQVDQMRRPMRSYFLATSQFYAGYDCFHSAAQRLSQAGWEAGPPARQTLAAKIAIHDVDFGRIMGEYPRAIEVTEPRLALLETDHAYADLAAAQLLLREAYMHVGRGDDASAAMASMLETAEKIDRYELKASLVMEQGHQAFSQGSYDEALALYDEALEMFAPLENPRYQAIIYDYIGQIHAYRGDFENAVANQERALRLARAGDLTYSEAIILVNISPAYYELGRVDAAFESIQAAKTLLLKLNQRGQLVTATVNEGDFAAGEGEWARAGSLYRDGLRQALSTEVERFIVQALARFPRLLIWQGRTELARQLADVVLAAPTLARIDKKWVDQALTKLDDEPSGLDSGPFAGMSLADTGAHILRHSLTPLTQARQTLA
jgi:predicted ATPase/DNA-binding SARP family transcriptional activator